MEMSLSLKSFHVLWAGIWVSDCYLLAPRCHPLLGNPTWSQLSGHMFFLCGGTVKAERSAFHPRQLRALPVPFSFTRGYCLITIFWGSREKNSIHDRSVLCAVGKLLLSLVHKNLAWAFRSYKTTCLFNVPNFRKAGRSRGGPLSTLSGLSCCCREGHAAPLLAPEVWKGHILS